LNDIGPKLLLFGIIGRINYEFGFETTAENEGISFIKDLCFKVAIILL